MRDWPDCERRRINGLIPLVTIHTWGSTYPRKVDRAVLVVDVHEEENYSGLKSKLKT